MRSDYFSDIYHNSVLICNINIFNVGGREIVYAVTYNSFVGVGYVNMCNCVMNCTMYQFTNKR